MSNPVDVVIITLYGGPNHGRRYQLPDQNMAFLRAEGGHYARVRGGGKLDFYWYEGLDPPMAVMQCGHLVPVGDYHNAEP